MTFKPDWICEAQCKLMLVNSTTKDEFEYEIKGIAEEPLAERHIILNCPIK